MGKEKQHLKLALSQARDEVSCSVEAIGFGKGSLAGLITQAAKVDVLGELSINEWNGVRKPQIVMQDLKITHMQLFDWRGAGQLSAKLNMLQNNLTTSNTKNQVPGVVLFDESDVQALRPQRSKLATPSLTGLFKTADCYDQAMKQPVSLILLK